jgi:V8-like Glu-specific endopeptidase
MMRYENQSSDDERWAMGTGWLIAPDLLVTAGHCAFDFGDDDGNPKLGRAVHVKAYMGYAGEQSLKESDVQFLWGATFITPAGWLNHEGRDRTSDVAFLKLDGKFTGKLNIFSYTDTPLEGKDNGKEWIGVIGYPADRALDDEEGAEMYQMFSDTRWNLNAENDYMLQYGISTFQGNSSPSLPDIFSMFDFV